MELTHRETDEQVDISSKNDEWEISGDEPAASRIAVLLGHRCDAVWVTPPTPPPMDGWDHEQAMARASCVARTFENELLAPFAIGHLFWGSWKWIGWFATDFTWVGRWIMDALIRNDSRAVILCIDWLREGTRGESQSAALRYALEKLTGLAFASDQEWVYWYDVSGGAASFPEPDMHAWFADLKTIHGE